MKALYPWSIEPDAPILDELPPNPVLAYKAGWRACAAEYDLVIKEIYERIVDTKTLIEDDSPLGEVIEEM